MSTFVCADLHLGHQRIISYCNRPFKSINEMDYTIIKNWNRMIKPYDKVFFLGDLSFRSHNTEVWIPKLNGKIIFIKGNHDNFERIRPYKYYILKYKGINFYLTHSPYDIPPSWTSWAIHGHKHNNNTRMYPFFNPITKRFNVSCELTGYEPVNMNDIVDVINK